MTREGHLLTLTYSNADDLHSCGPLPCMITAATSQFHLLFNIVGFFPVLENVFLSGQMNGLLFYEIFCQRGVSYVVARTSMWER